jgi:hypothetical protein
VVPVHKQDKLDHEPETSLRESNIEKHNRRTKQRVDKTAVIEGAAIAPGMCRCREAQARIVPDNPFAFPPSLEVRCARTALAANIPERKA